MKSLIYCSLLAAFTLTSLRAADDDKQVQARNVALDLAGAFSNDGFKIRDGHWAGPVKSGERAVVAVNLYAGNQYWFSVGSEDEAAKFAVQLYDESGKPMTAEDYHGDATAAAGFSPTISGQYFVSITPDSADSDSTYCLVYSYK